MKMVGEGRGKEETRGQSLQDQSQKPSHLDKGRGTQYMGAGCTYPRASTLSLNPKPFDRTSSHTVLIQTTEASLCFIVSKRAGLRIP